MINEKKIIAIIPSRKGSKRLPGKNIKDLCGKPLIAWTIEAAKQSSYIDKVLVSTDDQTVIDISKQLNVSAPFLRPSILSSDTAKTIDVIKHSLKQMELKDEVYDYMILLQPTSPLRKSVHIDEAIELIEENKANSVISVTEALHLEDWLGELDESMLMDDFFNVGWRRSDNKIIKSKFIINGAIYINLIKSLKNSDSLIYKSSSYAYMMNKEDSIDIDDIYDFLSAEAIMSSDY